MRVTVPRSRGKTQSSGTGSPTPSGKRVRNLLTAFVFAAAVAGSIRGEDDDFPFAPFRMYSTTTSPSGSVSLPFFEGVTASGVTLRFQTQELGLRSAEVLGQMERFRRNPNLLGHLARAHDLEGEAASHLVRLRLVQEVHSLRDGRPHSRSEEIVSVWREP